MVPSVRMAVMNDHVEQTTALVSGDGGADVLKAVAEYTIGGTEQHENVHSFH